MLINIIVRVIIITTLIIIRLKADLSQFEIRNDLDPRWVVSLEVTQLY
jgi:hypothetical protein